MQIAPQPVLRAARRCPAVLPGLVRPVLPARSQCHALRHSVGQRGGRRIAAQIHRSVEKAFITIDTY